jgi:hypothetical protein
MGKYFFHVSPRKCLTTLGRNRTGCGVGSEHEPAPFCVSCRLVLKVSDDYPQVR